MHPARNLASSPERNSGRSHGALEAKTAALTVLPPPRAAEGMAEASNMQSRSSETKTSPSPKRTTSWLRLEAPEETVRRQGRSLFASRRPKFSADHARPCSKNRFRTVLAGTRLHTSRLAPPSNCETPSFATPPSRGTTFEKERQLTDLLSAGLKSKSATVFAGLADELAADLLPDGPASPLPTVLTASALLA